jgi:hypothetical protein
MMRGTPVSTRTYTLSFTRPVPLYFRTLAENPELAKTVIFATSETGISLGSMAFT